MILIIDNYDSFTYNLYQYIGEINPHIEVYRNDRVTIREIRDKKPSHIIISPGPGFPAEAGICIEAIRKLGGEIPVLGVCLGHQAVGEAYGGKIVHAKSLMHGKTSEVKVSKSCKLFDNLPERIKVGRYHSLIVQKDSLPQELEITAVTDDGEIMGLKHKKHPVYGIQFHPESIMTPDGKKILKNFLD
ncbi:MAG: aminodeoxychorismate/anthranilate synthase component II [Clostridia bacterium]|nr:aminodeoxychorismate/anthranilate synthase component II [Clostridia bacterium]